MNFSAWAGGLPEYMATTGIAPVAYDIFVGLPLDLNDMYWLAEILPQIAKVKAVLVVTLEPSGGLPAVTSASVLQLATVMRAYEMQGVSFLVRFAHEMNGAWYPWGQQPAAYVAAFRMVASIIHNNTCGAQMLWAPNNGYGYPWPFYAHAPTMIRNQQLLAAKPGTANYVAMDTNGDSVVDNLDDPYEPYYPGDASVDWVGMSVYHVGGADPRSPNVYDVNTSPGLREFSSLFSGGAHDFYGPYAAARNKPMSITETAALWNPAPDSRASAPSELQVKSLWWEQVLNAGSDTTNALSLATHFPLIKMTHWFDYMKARPTGADGWSSPNIGTAKAKPLSELEEHMCRSVNASK
ncbi:hypothetical protein WJX81_002084 [Elliptochloris bilobata]|uniref:GH26 domain-containing protein n=1 Tax=Elliptochloris bilobata TaxID=381761 RepID=A0AAW1QN07_9CHLO